MRTGMKMNPTTITNSNIVLCLMDHPKCAGMTCTVNIYLIGFVKQKKVQLLPHLIGAINPSSKTICMDLNKLKRRKILGIVHFKITCSEGNT